MNEDQYHRYTMLARETSVIREGDPESLRRKTCEQFQLV
jgi:hypothetical protein